MPNEKLLHYIEQEIQDLIPLSTKNNTPHTKKHDFSQGLIDGQIIALIKIEQALLNGFTLQNSKITPAGSFDFPSLMESYLTHSEPAHSKNT